jgi:FMN-dependent NADH-azoreductase
VLDEAFVVAGVAASVHDPGVGLVPALETILGDPVLMALDVRTITPELTYAPTMDALRHLLPQHHASLEDAHTQARRLGEEVASITADPTIA